MLRVADIASVGWAEAEQLHITRYNGKRAVFISVRQKDNVSATTLRDALVTAVANYRATLPPDFRLELGFDQSRDIERRLGQLGKDFLIALALVLITLLPLGLRGFGRGDDFDSLVACNGCFSAVTVWLHPQSN